MKVWGTKIVGDLVWACTAGLGWFAFLVLGQGEKTVQTLCFQDEGK
jgi:hypothetical protein